jgi:hypothetical protein
MAKKSIIIDVAAAPDLDEVEFTLVYRNPDGSIAHQEVIRCVPELPFIHRLAVGRAAQNDNRARAAEALLEYVDVIAVEEDREKLRAALTTRHGTACVRTDDFWKIIRFLNEAYSDLPTPPAYVLPPPPPQTGATTPPGWNGQVSQTPNGNQNSVYSPTYTPS